MSWILDLLKRAGLWRTPDLVHATFGPMHFEPERNGFPPYWECWQETATKHGYISVLINADRSGPTDAQVRFFEELCDSIERIQAELTPFLEERYFRDWAPDPRDRKRLTWCGVTVPRGGDAGGDWELNFETNDRAGHMLTITFEKGKPVDAVVDG